MMKQYVCMYVTQRLEKLLAREFDKDLFQLSIKRKYSIQVKCVGLTLVFGFFVERKILIQNLFRGNDYLPCLKIPKMIKYDANICRWIGLLSR